MLAQESLQKKLKAALVERRNADRDTELCAVMRQARRPRGFPFGGTLQATGSRLYMILSKYRICIC